MRLGNRLANLLVTKKLVPSVRGYDPSAPPRECLGEKERSSLCLFFSDAPRIQDYRASNNDIGSLNKGETRLNWRRLPSNRKND